MVGTHELETVLDVCSHKHRRIVLAALTNRERPISIDDLTDEIIKHNHHAPPTEAGDETVTQVQVSLYHVHLPKLAEAGFIQYDRERQVVESTPQVGREDSRLSTILAMDSDLPTTPRGVCE
jgi:DNA-binding transcriptional ArsR family regulator